MRHAAAALLLTAAPLSLAAAHTLQSSAPAAAPKPVAKEQLLVPVGTADHYVVVSDAGKHGDMWRWKLPDGRIAFRHSQSLRGWITETDATVRYGSDGRPAEIVVRGITPSGDAAETYTESGGNARWTSSIDSGAGPAGKKLYLPAGGPGLVNAWLIEQLGRGRRKRIGVLPPAGVPPSPSGPAFISRVPSGPENGEARIPPRPSSPRPCRCGWTIRTNIRGRGWISSFRLLRSERRRCGTSGASVAAEGEVVAKRFLTDACAGDRFCSTTCACSMPTRA
jgi:hypothetical protein